MPNLPLHRRELLQLGGWSLAVAAARLSPQSTTPVRAWDIHCHLTSLPGDTPEKRMAALVKAMDRVGIERVMLSLGSIAIENPTAEQMRSQNEEVMRAVRAFPDRAYGFVFLNPNIVDASLQEFDRFVRDGPMVGVKLWIAKRCNAPELDPIVERATALKAPILQHTWMKVGGNYPGESSPHDLVELAARHPNARLICGHTGGDWEQGIPVVRDTNIVIEIAGSDPTAGFVEMAVRELGEDRILFGSDAGGRSFGSQLGKVLGAEISEQARAKVLAGNLRGLLRPMLQSKGYPV